MLTEAEAQEIIDTAHSVGSLIALYFLEAAQSEDFRMAAIARLVKLADSMRSADDIVALNVVIGTLARLEHTYVRAEPNPLT